MFALAGGRLAAAGFFDGQDGSLAIKDYILLESPRKERAHLDLSEATPGARRYSGGSLPSDLRVSPKMYTFKASFRVDPSMRSVDLALYMGLAEYPYRLYLNGIEIFAKGRYQEGHYNSSLRTVDSVYLSPDLLRYGADDNAIALEAYPQYETWGLDRIYVDRRAAVDAAVFLRNFIGINVIQGAFVLALLLGMYFVALFLFARRKFGKYIVCSLICAAFCLSYCNITIHYDANDEVLLEAMSKGGIILMSSFMLIFCCEFTSVLNRRRIFPLASLGLGAIAAILVMTRPSKESILTWFGYAANWLIVPQLLADIAILLLAFFSTRSRRVLPLLASFAIIAATAAHDVVFLNKSILPYAWLAAYGYLAAVIAIVATLAMEQGNPYIREPKAKLSLGALGLSDAEQLNILNAIGGKSVKTTAAEFGVSESTVRNTLARAYKKLKVAGKTGLATLAEKYDITK
jgi:DNA-binding CsgD family transcriptional regulator